MSEIVYSRCIKDCDEFCPIHEDKNKCCSYKPPVKTSMYDLEGMIEACNPEHYTDLEIEPWDYIIRNNLGYLEGNIVKYVSRYKKKGGREDLLKARTYLDKLLETER